MNDLELFLAYNIELKKDGEPGTGEAIEGEMGAVASPLWRVYQKHFTDKIHPQDDLIAERAPRVKFLRKAYEFLEQHFNLTKDSYSDISLWFHADLLIEEFGDEARQFFDK